MRPHSGKVSTPHVGSVGPVEESIQSLRMADFLFEADDDASTAAGGEATKKKVIKLVQDVQKAMAKYPSAGMPETAKMFDIARKTLLSELNNEEEASILLFTLAPQAIEGVRGVLEAIKMAAELKDPPITGSAVNSARVYSTLPGPNVLFDDKADLQKIINNGFKANPGFFKSLVNSNPAFGFIKGLMKGKETVENRNFVQDPFAHLPPLFEDEAREEPLNEAGKSIAAGALAGAAAGAALAGPLAPLGAAVGGLIGAAGGYFTKASAKHAVNYYTALSKGGPVSGKGSVASYMPLFKNQPIHKAILEDLEDTLTLENAIAIADAIEAAFVAHIRVKPPKPRADLIAGIGDMSSEDEKVNVKDVLGTIRGLTDPQRSKIIDYLKDNLRATWGGARYIAAWAKDSSEADYLALASDPSDPSTHNKLKALANKLAGKMMPNFVMSVEKIKNTIKAADDDDLQNWKRAVPRNERNLLIDKYKSILDALHLKWEDAQYKPFIQNRTVRSEYDNIQPGEQGKFLIKYFIKPNLKVKEPGEVIREGADESCDILIERWQRLAGIIK